MEIYIAEQTIAFLTSWAVGALIGLLFDVFRSLQIVFKPPILLIHFYDISFFIASGCIIFLYSLRSVDGNIRAFIIIGILIGVCLYFFILSKWVLNLLCTLLRYINYILKFIVSFIFSPIIKLFNCILLKSRYFFNILIIKLQFFAKNHLK